ncbi:MAG: thioredoxin fold domain-containing protein [Bacteroidota bacterium]
MKHLTHLLAIIIFLLFQFSTIGQEIRYDRVDFQNQPVWSEVIAKAKETGKIIFLDGYTTWCRPCKKMEKEVFTRAQVANYFNQKFINVKFDMEKGEGPDLKFRYGISAFPTYLFITGSGEVVHRIVGAHTEGNDFLEHSKLASIPGKSYADLQKRYRDGERNSELIFRYLKALRMAGELEKEKGLVDDYLRLMTEDHFMDPAYWGIVKVFLKDPASREFKILVENRTAIGAAIGEKEVDKKIYSVFDEHILRSMDFNNWSSIKSEDEATVILRLRNMESEKRNELLARALVAQHYRNGDYYDFVAVVDAMIDFNLLRDYEKRPALFIEYASVINKMAIDGKLLRRALRWVEMIDMKKLAPSEKTAYFKVKEALGGKL